MREIIMDAVQDTLPMIPLLFLTYILLEYMEHHFDYQKSSKYLKYKRLGPLFGSIIGILPQCGFSVAAAGLYIDHAITFGTMTAVFIATSDEAIPILMSYPQQFPVLVSTILFKIAIGFSAGMLIDLLYRPTWTKKEQLKESYDGCHHTLWVDAAIRTLKITCFVFAVNIVLGITIAWIGEDRLSSFLMNGSVLQPLLASLFGFIPNCAASVILTQLYISSSISYGSLVAGLITNAGLGMLILLKSHHHKKDIIILLGYLFIIAYLSGLLLQILF